MNQKETRWEQRFTNFEKAFLQLKSAVDNFEKLDKLSREGLVQRFEYTFELAWKTMKDYLESNGIITKFPRETIKHAFQTEIINKGEVWLDMLEKRNMLAHTYDEKNFNEATEVIVKSYYPEISELYYFLKNEQ